MEVLLLLLLAGASLPPLLLGLQSGRRGAFFIATGLCAFSIVVACIGRPSDRDSIAADLPVRGGDDEFVTSRTCRACHPAQYESWHHSFHRTMTQVASPESVEAPFDGREMTLYGRKFRLERRGEEFWVEMPDLDWEFLQEWHGRPDARRHVDGPTVRRRIVMTTGSHHYQGYWVPSRAGNELWQFPFVYHLQERRWLPRQDAFLGPPSELLPLVMWNEGCINCHSTAGEPGHDEATQEFNSRVVELGISCESCHGPAAWHVNRHRDPLHRYRRHLGNKSDETIVHPARCSKTVSAQICGHCHAFSYPRDSDDWWSHGYRNSYRAGRKLEDSRYLISYAMEMPEEEPKVKRMVQEMGGLDSLFWADGTVRVGGREYHGLVESPCYQRGEMTCLSCHSMHGYEDRDDQLSPGMRGNRACTQCHGEARFTDSIETHTHHRAGSAGSLCYNCHMPYTSYALFKGIRSHRVDSPSAANSVRTGRPGACNLCHLDRTLEWTSERLGEWYGQEAVALDEDQRNIAASLLWLLKGDGAQRVIAAWHMGWRPAQEASGDGWSAAFLAPLLIDPYPAVRMVAHRSLRTLPGFEGFDYDFLAPTGQRRQARDRVRRLWMGRGTTVHADRRGPLLLDGDGTLQEATLQRLLEERDDRPVYIAE